MNTSVRSRKLFCLVLIGICSIPLLTRASLDPSPSAAELAEARRWTVSKLGFAGQEFSKKPPFSFVYGGKPSSELLPQWKVERSIRELDPQRVQRTIVYQDKNTGLQVRCVAVRYKDFPTIEWTVYFKNTGTTDTPILSDVRALDSGFERNGSGEFVLHHEVGTFVAPSDFEP